MAERTTREMLPLGQHIDDWTIVREGGVQIRVWQISGLPWELETNRSIMQMTQRLNATIMNLADPRLTYGVHVCKTKENDIPKAGLMRHTWPRQLDRDYREKVLGADLTRNSIYITLAFKPGPRVSNGMAKWFGGDTTKITADDLRRMNELSGMLERDLAGYDIVRLGLRGERRKNGVFRWYSQVAEAIHVILYGRFERVPMTPPGGSIGRSILRHRPVFVPGSRCFEVRLPGVTAATKYHGAMFGATGWPEAVEPGCLNNLLDFPGGMVLTLTFAFTSKAAARDKMKRRQGHAGNAGEEEEDDIGEIGAARKEHHRKLWVLGYMHMSVAVYAPTLPGLDKLAGEMHTRLLDAGFAPVQEDLNLDAAWAAQAPGNWHKITRRDPYTSRNLVALAPLHDYPSGDADPLWGDYVQDFRTTGDTLYRHNLHRGEIGSTLLLGLTGAGKSVLANFLVLGTVERLNARGAMFDMQLGSKPFVLGTGGSYLELRYGQPSGLSPLKAAENEPGWLGHLVDLFKACIKARAPEDFTFEAHEDTRLERAIGTQLRMPSALRSWAGVRQVLGWSNPRGAGAWLEPWCEGGALEWIFANDDDQADMTRRLVGFDGSEIKDHPEVCGPIYAHLSYRISRLANGEPLVLYWDEVPQALKIPVFEDIIGSNLAQIRKNNGVVILASQGPAALLDSAIGPVIREQTPTKISFANQDASWEEYREIGFTPVMFRMVTDDFTREGVRRFVISRAGASVVCDFDLSPIKEHLWMLSGRASTCRELDRIIDEYGSDPDVWVPIFMERAPKAHARAMAEAARRAAEDEKRAKQATMESVE